MNKQFSSGEKNKTKQRKSGEKNKEKS